MVYLLKYLLIFTLASFLGWVIEFFYRSFFGKAKKFVNPGFLNGPYLPMYGIGAIVLYVISTLQLNFYLRLITIGVLMTLVEYIGGLISLKYYKVRLWDYRNEWLNYRGLICVKYSFFWVILGLLFNQYAVPKLDSNITYLYSNLQLSFFVGLFYGIFIIDLVERLDIIHTIRKYATELNNTEFAVNFEELRIRLDRARREVNPGFKLISNFSNIDIRKSILEIENELANRTYALQANRAARKDNRKSNSKK